MLSYNIREWNRFIREHPGGKRLLQFHSKLIDVNYLGNIKLVDNNEKKVIIAGSRRASFKGRKIAMEWQLTK